ncbi:M48 family metalloprotease [Streptomyces sp. NPDC002054]|uniref:M48 family metalloprotease n=1 Tax=Streptomyces sp. NPDC002054 TaxID=3154663 RepID=UPI00331ADDEC
MPEPDDDLDYRHAPGTRVHYTAHQRGAGLTALGGLALHLPGALFGLLLIGLLSRGLQSTTGIPYGIPVALWLAAGVLCFHRPTEVCVARYLLRLHPPLPEELALLTSVWREVTVRAGVDGSRYQLWIEESGDVTSSAAGGHLVIVTRRSLDTLPTSQLAAVLAHELGHHTAGHTWSRMLTWWYALPGRLLWLILQPGARLILREAKRIPALAALLLGAALAWAGYLTLAATYGAPLLLLALPFLTAAVGRRAELRADRHAALLGFGPPLAEVLAAAAGPEDEEVGTLQLLLSPDPHHRTRLHRLQPYLPPPGRERRRAATP